MSKDNEISLSSETTFTAGGMRSGPVVFVSGSPSSGGTSHMVEFGIPDDPEWLAAVGRLALRHAQLEHVQRLTVKTIEGLTVEEADNLLAHKGAKTVRIRIEESFAKKITQPEPRKELADLLEKCRKASQDRNNILHAVWVYDPNDTPLFRPKAGEWGPPPSIPEIEQVEKTILAVTYELNTARLRGFIRAALEGR